MRILRIGDPHIKPSNVEECEKLMHFINDTILERKPDRVEILGDLFHTHSVIRLEVLEFWDGWIDVLKSHENVDIYALVGNHDKATTEEFSYTALSVFRHIRAKNLKIVELPRVDGLYAYMPYYANPEVFIEAANRCAEQGAKVLVCHQTFAGAHYETGFLAPDGVDVSKVNFNLIISGHIHTMQTVQIGDKTVFYQGTPKWDTASDANENKGIWMYEHDDQTGTILSKELISTAHVVTPMVSLIWKEGEQMPQFLENAKTALELIGTSAWIEKQKAILKGNVRLSTKITDRLVRKERKAGTNFPEFVSKLFVTDVDKDELLKYMKGINLV